MIPSPAWRLLNGAADLGCIAGGVALAIRQTGGSWPGGSAILVPLLALAVAAVLFGRSDGLLPGHRPWRRIAAAAGRGALAAALASAAGVATSAITGGWPVVVAAAGCVVPPLVGARTLLWLMLRGGGTRRAVLVGPLDCRIRLREHLAAHPACGLVPVAEVGPGAEALPTMPRFELDQLEQVVLDTAADEVLISTGFDDRLLVVETMARLLERPLIVRYVPDPEALPLFCPRPADIAGLPAIDLSRGPLTPGAEALKWVEDKAVATVALAVLGLPMLLIAALIRLGSPGPALFVQERQGRYGRPIRVFKFRTMRYEAGAQDVTTGRFRQAAQGDLRITAIGRFLRNTSLDELPQFLNVLLGDMSVVGPRPHVRALNRRFASDIGELMRRHYVKPGITGLAQISGARGETRTVDDMRRRVAFDLEYLRHWSIWLDVQIILRTLFTGWINRHP